MKKRTISEKIMWILIVVIFLMSSYYFPRGKAEEKVATSNTPSDIKVVTDEKEKEILLGTTSEKAKRENLLGLAGEFSVFARQNVTLSWADTEGRMAAGGTIKATTSYPYHIGTEVKDDGLAKIIAGQGIENLELEFTTHNTENTNFNTVYDHEKKKIAVVGTNANNMDWTDYTASEKKQIIASDLIDFDKEFDLLQKQSNYIANLPANGTIIKSGTGFSVTNSIGGLFSTSKERNVVIFKGTNKKMNIFTMTVDEYNNMFSNSSSGTLGSEADTIFFDVPYGSYIIVNITGAGNVNMFARQTMSQSRLDQYINHFYKAAIYYPMAEEDMVTSTFKSIRICV